MNKQSLPDSFEPGSYGFHEMIDRLALISALFSREIVGHPAADHPKLAKQIAKVDAALADLYNRAATIE